MYWDFSKMYELFCEDEKSKMLIGGYVGLEKESQRVTQSGDLALTKHPEVLGDKFSNPYITTDFSESQVEIITPPLKDVKDVYNFLTSKHIEVQNAIGEEFIWPFSMPPRLPKEEAIPISKFDDSEAGREKYTYIKGLALRYGKKMQMISGIHYNISFSEELLDYLNNYLVSEKEKRYFRDDLYFSVARNFLRYRWVIVYLYGASPAMDSTYSTVFCHELNKVQECLKDCNCFCYDLFSDYNKYATSLRVSKFGYPTNNQGRKHVSFNSLEEHSNDIRQLLSMKSEEYSKLGLFKDGEQIQLNGNVIQKESEFYSPIRLKQCTDNGETMLEALGKKGVKYVELRIFDLNPYEKVGVTLNQLYFVQVFALFCLFEENVPIENEEFETINRNHHVISLFGRKENIVLEKYEEGSISLVAWLNEIFEKLRKIANLMDKNLDDKVYLASVEEEYKKVLDPKLLPSARIADDMADLKQTYLNFGIERAIANKEKQ